MLMHAFTIFYFSEKTKHMKPDPVTSNIVKNIVQRTQNVQNNVQQLLEFTNIRARRMFQNYNLR